MSTAFHPDDMSRSARPAPASRCPVDLSRLPLYDAREMMKNGAQALIALDGQVYTLRITRAGKLILTK